ncbi:di-heme oxidoredictase family protein [Amphritea pacifica]|uniref:C-type cytochrome n=2 Tax=Amphritea pacifica TaxID=2811233 RepID=A0ABS2W2Q7_9GAMM|nr:di-heme oxidoredictase family protein [Amphritea pacifica]MBN0985901.1 c-type cytochrome [Amphritea pacifica]MBN1008259.1 c-type cytochrome [Amphritea pacifica]
MICRDFSLPLLVAAVLMTTAASAAQDYSQPQPGEALPGGSTTHHKQRNTDAFSQSSANMSFENELNFKLGNGIFKKIWVPAPSSTTASDGLGPLYNARACQRCHLKDGRGHPPEANWPEDNAVSMFLRLSIPPQNDAQRQLLESGKVGVIPEPTYGGQLQDLAINGLAGEGRMVISYRETTVTLADGSQVQLRKPDYSITELSYGPLHPQTLLSPRIAPPMIGLGLLEALPATAIEALSDPEDRDNDGISGRPNRVWNSFTQQQELGRFGWKAGNPTLIQQAVGAFNGDMGISTPFAPSASGDCTAQQLDCLKQPNGNTPQQDNAEASEEMVKLVEFYSRNLAPPARPDAARPQVLKGKAVFHQSGCAACHQPSFTTASRADMPEQSAQLIWPYSDLLLHDMGEGLADNRPEFLASGSEWRTPPLWGIGLTQTVNGHTYFLHDGRARNLLEAVLWHGGEAQASRDHVINLPTAERAALLTFLESL